MLLVGFRLFDGFADGCEVVAVLDRDGLEAERFHTFLHVLAEGDVRAAFDRDAVAVVEDDELRQAERAGEREGLGRDALHHAAVAAKRERVVVDDVIARLVERRGEMRLGHRHADGHAHAGAKRPRRRFDARRVAVLRMARRQRAVLTELLHVIHGQSVAIEMEQRIQQRRAVAAREDEAVAVRPLRILRVVVHVVRPELIGHRRRAERQARVAGVRFLDRVRREHADGVDAFRVDVCQDISLLLLIKRCCFLYFIERRPQCPVFQRIWSYDSLYVRLSGRQPADPRLKVPRDAVRAQCNDCTSGSLQRAAYRTRGRSLSRAHRRCAHPSRS